MSGEKKTGWAFGDAEKRQIIEEIVEQKVTKVVSAALEEAFRDLRESAETRHLDQYDCRSVEDHFRNAASEVLVESINLMNVFD
jgi:hypothetical protein